MDLPSYIKSSSQENYNEELSQTLLQGVSDKGFEIPALTNAQLTTDIFIAPDGTLTTLANYMGNGTFWYITDAIPPCYVGKINGALVKFTTTAYP